MMNCLTKEQLSLILLGRVSEQQASPWVQHLDRCPACRARLEQVAGGTDWVLTSDAAAPETLDEARLEQYRAIRDAETRETRPVAAETCDVGREADGTLSGILEPTDQPDYAGRFGRFLVASVIGRGGMGIVLKARDPSLDRIVAVKVLSPQLSGDATARRRFIREARAAARVENDHVVAIHAVSQHRGNPYLVMPFINGPSLERLLRDKGRLDMVDVARLARHAARALHAAHQAGLVHRDIKPGNILLETRTGRYKVADFGLARAVEDPALTRTGLIAGTPHFMAPEQAAGRPIDHRADLYSLGAVLFAACTGRPPFQGATALAVLSQVVDQPAPDVHDLNAAVPDWLVALIRGLMEKDPDRRVLTAAAVLEKCAAHRLDVARAAEPAGPGEPAPADPRRRAGTSPWRQRWPGLLVGALALGLLLLLIWKWPPQWTPLSMRERTRHGPSAAPLREHAANTHGRAVAVARLRVQMPDTTWLEVPDLRAALATARDGSTIEIRGGVPILCDAPLDTAGKRLVIRATLGPAPVISFGPDATSAAPARLIARAPLVLEGIEFRYVARGKQNVNPDSLLLAQRCRLRCTNCRFTVSGSQGPRASCMVLDDADAELRNCMLSCSTRGSALVVVAAEQRGVTIANSVLMAENAVTLRHALANVPRDRPAVKLQSCTLIAFNGLRLWKYGVGRALSDRQLNVRVQKSLFDVAYLCTVSLPTTGQPLPTEIVALDQLSQTVHWSGSGNFFSIRRAYCGMSVGSRPGAPARSGPHTLAAWRTFCHDESEQSAEGEVQFRGAAAGKPLLPSPAVAPADCRFVLKSDTAPMSETPPRFGADPQSVGPGSAYRASREDEKTGKENKK